MKTNIKFIKYFSVITIIVFICSYILSLISFNNLYLNSNFLFNIFSGIFASFIVLLITEITKYIYNKKILEDYIYSNCLGLYKELTVQIELLKMYLENKKEILPEGVLDHRKDWFSLYSNNLRSVDYTTMKKKDPLFQRINLFIQQEIPKLEYHISNCNNLNIAINQTKINYYEQKGNIGYNPTTLDSLVNIAVQKIKASAEARKEAIDSFLQTMVSFYPNRFNWSIEKLSIDKIHFDMDKMHKQDKEFFEN